jgi:adenosylmethionine---8-amino-7-oxononanoate aminotransferase
MSLSERDQRIIWHPYTQMQTAGAPVAIVRGEGAFLIAEDGSEYLDMISSWWVNIHGHAHPYIAERVGAQLHILEHAIFAGFTHEPAIALAENLLKILPGNQAKVFYSDNGSTAVEVALKMALQFWANKGIKKHRILAFENAYHGDTFGAMSVSGRSIFTEAFKDLLFEVIFIPVPVPGQESQSLQRFHEICSSGDDIAAFIFEPLVQGTAGMVMYSSAALDAMLETAKQKNIVTIADEVMTGFGRTGKLFATDYLVHKPDIMCLSKGLTGGTMALGVTTCSAEIYNAFLSADKTKALFHGHSFTANPLACTAALASLELLLSKNCRDQIDLIAKNHAQFLMRIKTHPSIKNIRNIGTILAVELEGREGTSYLNEMRDYLYNFFMDRKILMRPLGNIIYLIPPYCINENQLKSVYNVIEEMLDQLSPKKL